MNELIVSGITVQYDLPIVKADLTPIKAQVEQIIDQYKGWVVSESDIDVAKKTTASLNKTAKALSDKRIEIEKILKQPITDFTNELKDLTKQVEAVSNDLKKQLDDYEEQRKADKRNEILASPLWASYMNFNEEWLNKSTKQKDIEADLLRQKGIFTNNCLLVEATCNGLGLSSDKYLGMLAEKREINEIIERITNDNEVRKQYATTPQSPQQAVPTITQSDVQDTDKYTITIRLTTTKTRLKLLKEYLTENEIAYEKV